ncbi:MAG: tetratricopeptide repeat protein, partial [Candidatus Hodarchaeota archaeon]
MEVFLLFFSQIPELHHVEQLFYMGEFKKSLQIIEEFENKGGLNEDGQLQCQILKSHLYIQMGQLKEGLKLAESAYNSSQRTSNVLTVIDALIAKATVLCQLGRSKECLHDVNEGENLLTKIVEDQHELAKRESSLKLIKGKVFRRMGELDQALEFIQESLTVRQEQGNVYATADPLNTMGVIHVVRGELDLALSYLEQSLKIYKDIGNKSHIIKICNNMANVYVSKAEYNRALELYQEALALSEKMGNKRYISVISLNIGLIKFNKGEIHSALEMYQKSLALFEELDIKVESALCLLNIGTVYNIRGELDLALEFYQRGLVIFEGENMKPEMASCFSNLGEI